MADPRWPEIKRLLDQALDLPLAHRETFLIKSCGEDLELLAEARAFLRFERDDDPLLETPILDLIAGRSPEYRRGEVVGAYRLEEEIARGGMGVVYRAERIHGGFEQKVAVKILKRGFDTGDFVRRFRTEQQILSDLDHPNIARLLDGGATEDGLPYLVMELIEGCRLDQFHRQMNPSVDQVIELFLKICEAVQIAHRHMVVHCDLKPSNILVSPEGEPKLLDFGIAKVLHQGPDATQSLSIRLGTPRYVSPEQRQGKPISTASDVFSLGGLLYLLLAGRAPAIIEDLATPLDIPSRAETLSRSDAGRIRGDLDAIVLKAREPDPNNRYGSVAELAADIRRHLSGLPVHARPYTFRYALQRFLIRRRREVTIAAVLLILSAGGILSGLSSTYEKARADQMMESYIRAIQILDSLGDESRADAVQLAVQELLAGEKLFKAEDQAKLCDHLGRLLYRLEDYHQAEKLLQRALELRQAARSDLVPASLNNLGLVYKALGDVDQAAALYGRAFDLYQTMPVKPEAFFDLLHNLAGVADPGQESERLYLEALAGRERVYGPESLEVARTAHLLGRLYWLDARFEKAAPLLERTARLSTRHLGKTHLKVAQAKTSLAALRLAQGKLDASVDLYREALEVRRRLGDNHSSVARTRSALGLALLARGSAEGRPEDLETSYRLLKRALQVHGDEHGSDHETTRIIQRNLGAVQHARGQLESAESLLRPLLTTPEDWSDANRWRDADIRNLLAAVLAARGRSSEAQSLFEGTLEIIVGARGERSVYAREAAARLAAWRSSS